MSPQFRPLPTLSEVLESPPLKGLVDRVQRHVLVSRAREVLEELRSQLQSATSQVPIPNPSELAQRVADWFHASQPASEGPCINATGALLDPRLGLPPLPDAALQAVQRLGRGWTTPEVVSPLEPRVLAPTGSPLPSLYAQTHERLARLAGTEAALVVHSPAAAAWLVLATLAKDRPTAVARKHLIERPGQVPLAAIAQAAGYPLLEVGTANCVRLEDYEQALRQQPAAIFFSENPVYTEAGWTADVRLESLVDLARRHRVPVCVELGGAPLFELKRLGIEGVLPIPAAVALGPDLVLASGHGWIGGPPCGLLVGRSAQIEAVQRHPFFGVAKAASLTIAALNETLRLYEDPGQAELAFPLLALASAPPENLRQRAERLAPQMAIEGIVDVSVVAEVSDLSGAGLPGHQLPTWCLAAASKERSAEEIQALLLKASPGILGKIKESRLLLDLRSVLPRDDVALVSAFRSVWSEKLAEDRGTS